MVTMKDIAKACGVSLATVSKALNGHADVGEETARHIAEIARQMGYLPNAAARMLKTNRSYNLGVLFEDKTGTGLRHEYFSGILDSIKAEAERLGYDITFISKDIGSMKMNYYEHSKYRNCDGVVVALADFKDPDVIHLVESEIPTVTLDHVFDNRTAIMSDNISGMVDIVNHVYGLGHKRIACIHGEDTAVTQKRLASFRKTCLSLGLQIPEEYIRSALYHDTASSAQATRELLALPTPPTCILFPDDFSYIGGMNEIERQGLSIPGDISVVGYDGILLSQVLRPRLTTYRQDAQEMGRAAAARLVEAIENPKLFLPDQVLVTGKLLPGETVRRI